MNRNFSRPTLGILTAITLAGAATMTTQAAHAQSAQAIEESNRELIRKGFDAWAAGTGSPYDLLAEDVNWTITGNSAGSKSYPSKEAFMGEVIRPFNARMQSRLIPTVHKLYAEGDTVIAHFDAQGTARNGAPYKNSYVWILKLANGRIVKSTAFFDSIAFDELWKLTPAQ